MTVRQTEKAIRRQEILAMREASLSYKAIGRKFGISRERVRQIINSIEKKPSNYTGRHSLTTGDVARILNIHPNTVRRWANNGTLKAYRIGSRHDRRFKREDIDRLHTETS